MADSLSEAYLKNIHNLSLRAKEEQQAEVKRLFSVAVAYSEEKVKLTERILAKISRYITAADIDIAIYEAENKNNPSIPVSSGAGAALKKKGHKVADKEEKKRQKAVRDDNKIPKSLQKKPKAGPVIQPEIEPQPSTSGINKPSTLFGKPVEPNEPIYCYCDEVAYGKMVACDNPDCPIEWFHFECVGLTRSPKGKWYCRECSAAKKIN